jgi:hypothetical protein
MKPTDASAIGTIRLFNRKVVALECIWNLIG